MTHIKKMNYTRTQINWASNSIEEVNVIYINLYKITVYFICHIERLICVSRVSLEIICNIKHGWKDMEQYPFHSLTTGRWVWWLTFPNMGSNTQQRQRISMYPSYAIQTRRRPLLRGFISMVPRWYEEFIQTWRWIYPSHIHYSSEVYSGRFMNQSS